MPKKKNQSATSKKVYSYNHSESKSLLRPDIGTQAQFKKKKPPITYRYDSSLSPELNWDAQNPAREAGEFLIKCIDEASKLEPPHLFNEPKIFDDNTGKYRLAISGLNDAVEHLKRLSQPFLNWTGKAERLSFDIPTLPLFVHERLSTKAILDTLKGHKRDKYENMNLFGEEEFSITDQILKAYEHQNGWVNRMMLGDSLVTMNSLLQYENLGGQVQMIYMDPPYGIKFGSNFQPFVRKRNVEHNADDDLTREPEMVKAYRDTWELGLHSYLTYMRDRLLVARDLLNDSGSIFVQISDENVHHVRELIEDIFGKENFVSSIKFFTRSNVSSVAEPIADNVLWFAKKKDLLKQKDIYIDKATKTVDVRYRYIEFEDGTSRTLSKEEVEGNEPLPAKAKRFSISMLSSKSGGTNSFFPYEYQEQIFYPQTGRYWSTNKNGLDMIAKKNRLYVEGKNLKYKLFLEDFPLTSLSNIWNDTVRIHESNLYAVQTAELVIGRCILMTTDPGDLVLDPTCGSGTTAYVAEQWGRRWISMDVSRVPLALARQRLLTATYPFYKLKDYDRGPAGGFVYMRKQNKKGDEVGGIVPHITLESIANNQTAKEEVLVDRPEVDNSIIRVTGAFNFEATIPTPVDYEGDGIEDSGVIQPEEFENFQERMLEVLRKSPVLQISGGRKVTLQNIRIPAKKLTLNAEASVKAKELGTVDLGEAIAEADEENLNTLKLSNKSVAIIFGPENAAISEKLVFEAAREAYGKSYSYLFVIGFAIQEKARKFIEDCEKAVGIPATYVQATPDLMMGDLLKNMRSRQIFSVCGLPEIKIHKIEPEKKDEPVKYQVELLGLDVFDPITMSVDHRSGDDVPAWFLDTDYNDMCFHVSQAFFPRTSAWDNLKRSLRAEFNESVWEHLSGAKSALFEAGDNKQVAVKVIDDRGNELLVVKELA